MQLYLWKIKEKESNCSNVEQQPVVESITSDTAYEIVDDTEPWLIENINAEESVFLLLNYKEYQENGTFLIRRSQRNLAECPYTLCVLYV